MRAVPSRFLGLLVLVGALVGCGEAGEVAPASSTTIAGTTTTTASATTEVPATTEASTTTQASTTTPTTEPCSAAGLNGDLPEQPGLPPAVGTMRRSIGETAAGCDIDGLGALALDGGFEWSINPNAEPDPAQYWRVREVGSGPLADMIRLLETGYGVTEDDGRTVYVWPAAAAYEEWSAVPADDRATIERLFTPDDVAAFEAENRYLGQSLGIAGDGTWLWYLMPGN